MSIFFFSKKNVCVFFPFIAYLKTHALEEVRKELRCIFFTWDTKQAVVNMIMQLLIKKFHYNIKKKKSNGKPGIFHQNRNKTHIKIITENVPQSQIVNSNRKQFPGRICILLFVQSLTRTQLTCLDRLISFYLCCQIFLRKQFKLAFKGS